MPRARTFRQACSRPASACPRAPTCRTNSWRASSTTCAGRWHDRRSWVRLSRGALFLLALDLALGLLAWWWAFWLRFNLDIPEEFAALALMSSPWCVLGLALGLGVARVDRHVWRFIGLAELRQLAVAVALGSVFTAVAVLMLRLPNFPRSVLLLQPVLA